MAYTKTFKTLPPAGKWTRIEVSQTLVDSKYIYSISISNKIVFKVQNKMPVELSKVKVYAGSPWYEARKGFLRNLKIEIMSPCVLAGAVASFLNREKRFPPISIISSLNQKS